MNAARRKAIADILSQLQGLVGEVEELAGEEREYFDNMPESLQGGERGELASAAADALENAQGAIDEAIGFLDEAGA